jgi:WD40 repeat protein
VASRHWHLPPPAFFEPLHAEVERTLEGNEGPVECLVMYGKMMISGSTDSTIKVWNTDRWTCDRILEGHGENVIYLVMHDNKLISGSSDHTIKVWNTGS